MLETDISQTFLEATLVELVTGAAPKQKSLPSELLQASLFIIRVL